MNVLFLADGVGSCFFLELHHGQDLRNALLKKRKDPSLFFSSQCFAACRSLSLLGTESTADSSYLSLARRS